MSCNRKLSKLAGVLALSAGALATIPASADGIGGGDANVKSMAFDAQSVNTTLHVISTDGQEWDKLKPGNVEFWGHMKLDTRWPGYVYEVGVVLGACAGGLCNSFPIIFSDATAVRDYDHQTNFSFPSSKIPVSTTGIALLSYGDDIIRRCNEHLQPDGPTKSHSFTYELWATFIANTGGYIHNLDNVVHEAALSPGPHHPEAVDEARKDSFEIQVVCDPVIKAPTDDVAFDHGDFDVEDVKLFLTTVDTLNPTGGNPGTVCPVLRVTARAAANQEGPVTMRIWEQLDGGPITSKVKQAWASYDAAKNGYFATYEEHKNFGVTTHAQYRVDVVDNSFFPPYDGWKDITVHCTGAGGGGLTTTPPVDPDTPQPQASWAGEIIVADSAGADKSCPRKGQVFFEVTREAPGDFDYRISCSNGAFFTGTATAYNQGGGVFKAHGAHDLNITRTRSIQCTLQELKPNGTPVTVDVDKKNFTCANPTFDPPTNDLTGTPRPTPQVPDTPVVVTPAPQCSEGLIFRNGRCFPSPVVVTPRPRTPAKPTLPPVIVTPRPQPECRGDTMLRNGRCVRLPTIVTRCDRDEMLVRGKCIKKPAVSILCKPGYRLVRDECVKTQALKLPQRKVTPDFVKPNLRRLVPNRSAEPQRRPEPKRSFVPVLPQTLKSMPRRRQVR